MMQVNKINNPFGKVYFYAECNSTMNLIDDHFEHGSLVVTDYQHGGHGRLANRVWQSSMGENLLATILLLPSKPLPLSFFVAASLHQMLDCQYNITASIKWPNDLLVHGKKMAGILCQYHEGFVKVGLGLNINQTTFENSNACSMAQLIGYGLERELVLNNFLYCLKLMIENGLSHSIVNKNLYDIDKFVRYQAGNLSVEGINRGIDAQGRLGIESITGMHYLVAGEEVIKIKN